MVLVFFYVQCNGKSFILFQILLSVVAINLLNALGQNCSQINALALLMGLLV